MKYGFIGLGNMACAILRGMRESGKFDMNDVAGYDVDPSRAGICGITPLADERAAASFGDVLVLAVKPQMLDMCLEKIDAGGRTVISIAAGKPTSYYESALPGVRIVRAMPNINAKVLCAPTALCGGADATEEDLLRAESIFSTIGRALRVPEKDFPAYSAVASASPAFAYLFIDALARAGVREGLPRALALQAAATAVLGSAKLVLESDDHPMSLVDQVCSPGGTTIEGVEALQRLGFESAIHTAVSAVVDKDRRL